MPVKLEEEKESDPKLSADDPSFFTVAVMTADTPLLVAGKLRLVGLKRMSGGPLRPTPLNVTNALLLLASFPGKVMVDP